MSSEAHTARVVRLLAGLAAFVLIYLALLVGCLAAAWLAIAVTITEPWIAWLGALLAAPPLGLAAFLIKGLLHRHAATESSVEIDAAEQPRLYEFLARVADQTGAAMPSAVRISHSVNAAMLRAGSLLGWLVGGKRQLVIGLGLVEALGLAEFEAVLAHEFGHYSQSSARVGQWAHQSVVIMRSLVLERDRFDLWLARARRSGGVLRPIAGLVALGVRGVRSLLGRVLTGVVHSSLALSRELEFDADRRAVALCGSDALVGALWQAQRGALALDTALAQLHELGKHGLFSEDLFAHQAARIAELERRLANHAGPMAEALRRPYRPGPALHFPPGEAPAEVMWYSHPSYREREAAASQPYVAGREPTMPALSALSAWSVFVDHQDLRRRLTCEAYRERLGLEPIPERTLVVDEIEARIAAELAERRQADHTHGFYDNRVLDPGELALDEAALDREALAIEVDRWRGAALAEFMVRWRALDRRFDRELEPHAELQALRDEQIAEAHAGDRAIYRWHWLLADPQVRAELVVRNGFLVVVQAGIVALNRHRSRVGRMFASLRERGHEPGDPLPIELLAALDELHRDLDAWLARAAASEVPRLQNVDAELDLRALVLPEPLLAALDDDHQLAAWLERFMPQVERVHERLRTLHYKNLGALLELHERIDPPREASRQSTW
ncbi:M48 family metalloprotease [Nannocystaceae bacterium ST9]